MQPMPATGTQCIRCHGWTGSAVAGWRPPLQHLHARTACCRAPASPNTQRNTGGKDAAGLHAPWRRCQSEECHPWRCTTALPSSQTPATSKQGCVFRQRSCRLGGSGEECLIGARRQAAACTSSAHQVRCLPLAAETLTLPSLPHLPRAPAVHIHLVAQNHKREVVGVGGGGLHTVGAQVVALGRVATHVRKPTLLSQLCSRCDMASQERSHRHATGQSIAGIGRVHGCHVGTGMST